MNEKGEGVKISPVCWFFLSQEQNLGNNTLHNAMSSTFWDTFSQFEEAWRIFFDGCILLQLVMWSLENGVKKWPIIYWSFNNQLFIFMTLTSENTDF